MHVQQLLGFVKRCCATICSRPSLFAGTIQLTCVLGSGNYDPCSLICNVRRLCVPFQLQTTSPQATKSEYDYYILGSMKIHWSITDTAMPPMHEGSPTR